MNKYKIDLSSYTNSGGYCTLYCIKNYSDLGFKEFISKQRAEYAMRTQIKLSKFSLAPKVYSKLCKLKYSELFPTSSSGWGYITEIASLPNSKIISLKSIQKLVDDIYSKTKLKFWDCHRDNLGYIIRRGKKKLVCVDTGKETWDGDANYFGNSDPGPKCSYCLKYKCQCLGD
jgi:hypothetical protein